MQVSWSACSGCTSGRTGSTTSCSGAAGRHGSSAASLRGMPGRPPTRAFRPRPTSAASWLFPGALPTLHSFSNWIRLPHKFQCMLIRCGVLTPLVRHGTHLQQCRSAKEQHVLSVGQMPYMSWLSLSVHLFTGNCTVHWAYRSLRCVAWSAHQSALRRTGQPACLWLSTYTLLQVGERRHLCLQVAGSRCRAHRGRLQGVLGISEPGRDCSWQ